MSWLLAASIITVGIAIVWSMFCLCNKEEQARAPAPNPANARKPQQGAKPKEFVLDITDNKPQNIVVQSTKAEEPKQEPLVPTTVSNQEVKKLPSNTGVEPLLDMKIYEHRNEKTESDASFNEKQPNGTDPNENTQSDFFLSTFDNFAATEVSKVAQNEGMLAESLVIEKEDISELFEPVVSTPQNEVEKENIFDPLATVVNTPQNEIEKENIFDPLATVAVTSRDGDESERASTEQAEELVHHGSIMDTRNTDENDANKAAEKVESGCLDDEKFNPLDEFKSANVL